MFRCIYLRSNRIRLYQSGYDQIVLEKIKLDQKVESKLFIYILIIYGNRSRQKRKANEIMDSEVNSQDLQVIDLKIGLVSNVEPKNTFIL